MAEPEQPTWSKSAKLRSGELQASYKDNLHGIASCFAKQDRAASVSVDHVERAHIALADNGLARVRWLEHPATLPSIGAFIIGFAFSAPDLVDVFYVGKNADSLKSIIVVTSTILGG